MRRFQHYIDGRFEDGTESVDSVTPATGERRLAVRWVFIIEILV